jgi:Spy/CpxP family protein refolding chaperone
MNKNVVYVAIFGVLCALAGVLVGATVAKRMLPPPPGLERMKFTEKAERFMGYRGHAPGEKRQGRDPLEEITKRLNLSEEQKAKVKTILESMRQETDNVRKNVRTAIGEIKKKTDSQIMEILTDEQKEKFKAFLKEIETKFGPPKETGLPGHHGRHPGGDLPLPR